MHNDQIDSDGGADKLKQTPRCVRGVAAKRVWRGSVMILTAAVATQLRRVGPAVHSLQKVVLITRRSKPA